MPRRVTRVAVLAGWLCLAGPVLRAQPGAEPAGDPATGAVVIRVTDAAGQPLPCRVHLVDASQRSFEPRGLPFWKDHFVLGGTFEGRLPAGDYSWEIERGPEFARRRGSVRIDAGGQHELAVTLPRIANLAEQGWYAGDLHVHRPEQQMPLLMAAEELHVAPVITWWNARNPWAQSDPPRALLVRTPENRYFHRMAGEDERGGGALLYFHLDAPLPIAAASREAPSSAHFIALARKINPRVWIDIEKPFWWDVPLWLSTGAIDSMGIANNHMCRGQMYETEAWGRPRDQDRLPAPRGNGYWTQEIYYHVLNCGLRVPPSAGSASGVLPNPVGYNRVYVKCGVPLVYEAWWGALRQGRSFVTNGPLLLCLANGEPPGHVFRQQPGGALRVSLDATLTTLDRVEQLEIIHNGAVARTLPLQDVLQQRKTEDLSFSEPGWFLVRAVASHPTTFRFACTAPYYIEAANGQPVVSRASARFFVDWVEERIALLEQAPLSAADRAGVLAAHEGARRFWHDLLARANAR